MKFTWICQLGLFGLSKWRYWERCLHLWNRLRFPLPLQSYACLPSTLTHHPQPFYPAGSASLVFLSLFGISQAVSSTCSSVIRCLIVYSLLVFRCFLWTVSNSFCSCFRSLIWKATNFWINSLHYWKALQGCAFTEHWFLSLENTFIQDRIFLLRVKFIIEDKWQGLFIFL